MGVARRDPRRGEIPVTCASTVRQLSPMPGEVVSNTGKPKTALSLDIGSNGGRPEVMTLVMSLQSTGRPLFL